MEKDYSKTRAPLPPEIKLEENVYVSMRDKIKIAVDVYRPAVEGRYPALISMSSYTKELQAWPPVMSHAIEAGNIKFFVSKGYVHVIASSRGTGLSQGQYNWYDIKEQQDGYDLVEWAAQQPWCNGNVSMFGESYFGRLQYLVAALQPPHLKCITPYDGGTDDYRDSRFMGGIPNVHFLGMWGFDLTLQSKWPGPVEGKLPPTNIFDNIASNPEDGPYYWERSSWPKIDKIKVPMFSIVSQQSFMHSRGQLAGYPKFKVPKKLLVAPPVGFNTHVFFIDSKPLNEQILKWLDYWLKGIDTGIMKEPEVTIYDSGTKEWRYENEYPLARTQWKKFYLHANPAGPSTSPPWGLISMEPPKEEKPDKYVAPEALSVLNKHQPVLAYASAPLEKDLKVWGPLSISLFGATNTRDTAWFIKVGDAAPDGSVTQISQGHIKASFREVDESRSSPGQPWHSFQKPVKPEPNKIYDYQIELVPIFHTFKAGHKIWVQIASHDFGYMTLAHGFYTLETLPLPAENVVYHDSLNPSHLLLPVIPDSQPIQSVSEPVSKIKWPL
jgi:uncharacterized protein